jgi:hypothetical protein
VLQSVFAVQGFAQPVAEQGNPAQSCGVALLHLPSPVHVVVGMKLLPSTLQPAAVQT